MKKVLATVTIALAFVVVLSQASLGTLKTAYAEFGEKKPAGEKVAVTIWILSYERRDANPLSDQVFLPKAIDPALGKLKEKGARKMNFNFEHKQLAIWFEGTQYATLKDVQAALPGLDLKVVAKAGFPADPKP
jgi:hypothetical protein